MSTVSISSIIKKVESNPHVQGLELPLKTLELILERAIDAYYNTDKPLLSDKTFDILFGVLQERDPSNILLNKVGAPIRNEDKVKLPYYLGSLDKVKPNEKSLTKWLSTHNRNILISDKLDGLSCLLIVSLPLDQKFQSSRMSDGCLRDGFYMKLYKHGDGIEGQNISHLLEHISIHPIKTKLNHDKITKIIKDTPTGHIALRGEIIISTAKYETKYKDVYPKARSLIAGLVNAKTPDNKIVCDMEIVFYEFIHPDGLTFEKQFEMITSLGFLVANHKMYKTLDENQLPEILMEHKRDSPYEIDGIVLDDSSRVWSRVKKENPDYAVAFKMQLEDQIATTTVINVEYNISKHGTLAPRIEYIPVMIKGDTHKYTTGFNLKYIVDNRINKGTQLQIIKSGDVIPYIYKIVKHSNEPQMPPSEIAWHWNNTHVDAILDNPEASIDVRLQKMVAFFKIMKIDGVGEGVVTKLIRGGYDDLQMILTITPDIISKVEGFQLKSATNIYNAIKKVIEKPQPLERVMTASGIFQIGLGEKKFKAILDAIPDFMAKYKNGKIGIHNITSISGFSDKTAGIFIDGMPRFLEWLTIHSMIKIDVEDIAKRDIPKGNKFAGIVVVFTGVRNSNMEKVITDGGGVVGSSITGKTTLLVAKDPSENSSKIEKAKNAGIQIISYEQFSTDYDL